MQEQDDQHGSLLAALEIGERDIAAGRTVPYTPDLLKQIEEEARKHAASHFCKRDPRTDGKKTPPH